MLLRSQSSDLGVVKEHCQSDREGVIIRARQREYGKFRRGHHIATLAVFSHSAIKTKDTQLNFVAFEILLPFKVTTCFFLFMSSAAALYEFFQLLFEVAFQK